MNNWQPDVKFEEGVFKFDLPNGDEFVIAPPQTKPLSDEEINQCWEDLIGTDDYTRIDIGRAIEAKVRGQ